MIKETKKRNSISETESNNWRKIIGGVILFFLKYLDK